MKALRKAFFPITFVLAIATCHAQDVTTTPLTWQVNSNRDQETQRVSNYGAVFRTTATTVTWIQRNGQRSSTYSIVSAEGVWTNVREQGSITLHLVRNDRQMNMVLSRDAEGPSIRLEVLKDGSPPFRQRMLVSNVAPTQQ